MSLKAKTRKNRLLLPGIVLLAYLITGGMIASIFLPQRTFPIDTTNIRIAVLIIGIIGLARYFSYMYISPFYAIWQRMFLIRHHAAITTYKPRVSVIIPARNEEVGLIATIKTALKSTYTNLEIVVINDGSDDQSHELMLDYLDDYTLREEKELLPVDILYRYIRNGGKGNALNTGIKMSTGDIIITVDADCLMTPKTIANFVRYFVDPRIQAVVGNVKIGNRKTAVGALQYLEYLVTFYFKKADSLMNTIYIIGGAAGAFRREVFERIGFYSITNITEDIDISVRIQKAGMKVVYAADAIIYTEGASDLPGLIRQRTRWKRGRFETFHQHRSLFFSFNRRYNKALSWLILPMALFGDAQLAFDLPFVLFLYAYGFISNDFGPFLAIITLLGSIFFTQTLFGERKKNLGLLFIAPVTWLIFYASTYVEMRALMNTLWQSAFKLETPWQQWNRAGTFEDDGTKTDTGTHIIEEPEDHK